MWDNDRRANFTLGSTSTGSTGLVRDVVVVREDDVLWFENLGGLQLGAPNTLSFSVPSSLRDSVLVDPDLDGDLDVCVARISGDPLWSENLGSLRFDLQIVTGTGSTSRPRVAVADFDLDDDVDVLIEGRTESSIAANRLRLGSPYCGPGAINSTGSSAMLTARGSDVASDDDVVFRVERVPASALVVALNGPATATVVGPGGSQGALCLGGPIGRHVKSAVVSKPDASAEIELETGALPTPTGALPVVAGQTWHFQCWYRDANPMPTSNLSDAVAVTFR